MRWVEGGKGRVQIQIRTLNPLVAMVHLLTGYRISINSIWYMSMRVRKYVNIIRN